MIICLKTTVEGTKTEPRSISKYREQQQFKPRLQQGSENAPLPHTRPFQLPTAPPSNYHQLVMFYPSSSHISHLNICLNAIFYTSPYFPAMLFPSSSLDAKEWNKKGENCVWGDSLKYFCWNKTVIMLSARPRPSPIQDVALVFNTVFNFLSQARNTLMTNN